MAEIERSYVPHLDELTKAAGNFRKNPVASSAKYCHLSWPWKKKSKYAETLLIYGKYLTLFIWHNTVNSYDGLTSDRYKRKQDFAPVCTAQSFNLTIQIFYKMKIL